MTLRRHFAAIFTALAGVAAALPVGAMQAQERPPVPAAIQKLAGELAAELSTHCPLAPAGDAAAYNNCRKALYGESVLRASLPPVLLWGRQSKNPQATLRQTNLTQFVPEVWTHLYAPLFMFNGKHSVQFVPEERKFLIRLEAAFRNRLAPGQFPYPFWHEEAKWATYENANGFMFWVDPVTAKVQAAQFTDRAPNAMLQAVTPVKHDFSGTWLWTDERGRTQPAVTLFDGLYQPGNPYLRSLDRQYRDLALQMRESQCTSCHVPNNPDKMSRLVLLSTPAHAAGEIERLIKAVKEDRMPMDDFRLPYALSPENKKWLLESAEAFKTTVKAAQAWEQQAAGKTAPLASSAAWQPSGPFNQSSEVSK